MEKAAPETRWSLDRFGSVTFENERLADCQSAIQQADSLRYEAGKIR